MAQTSLHTGDLFTIPAADSSSSSGGARTVMFESTTTTVFREDPEARALAVREFTVVDLVPVGEGEGGFVGFKAQSVVTYMDAAPVRMRALALFGQ
ncbi:hypothetical protein PspLS_01059 [Pyricularia sp. CBS 133598]|nr:hypothetical protein PspLS_01059 [Pyricularia sp. CBS 133598]